MGIGDELKNLSELHRQGALTDAEFDAAKKQVLEQGTASRQAPQLASPPVAAPAAATASPPQRRTNGLAIASFVLGLIGMGVGHILALVLGYRAKRQIDLSGGTQGGRGLAIAGLVLGWVGVVAAVTIAAFWLTYGRQSTATSAPGTDEVTINSLQDAINDAGFSCDWFSVPLGAPDSEQAQCGLGGDLYNYIAIAVVHDAARLDGEIQEQVAGSDEGILPAPDPLCFVKGPNWFASTGTRDIAQRLENGIGGDLICY